MARKSDFSDLSDGFDRSERFNFRRPNQHPNILIVYSLIAYSLPPP